MTEEKDVLILAIESSCDETAAAVIKNGREVLSNVISSQIELHKLYGGDATDYVIYHNGKVIWEYTLKQPLESR